MWVTSEGIEPAGATRRLAGKGGDLTDELIAQDWWDDSMVAAAGIPVRDVPLVTVGGGLGSFALVDYLRIAGVAPDQIAVLGINDRPWQTYAYLARNSQIPNHERLRSDAGSVMDNIWGFPSYAVREAFAAGSLRGFVAPLWQVMTEPILTDYYTPQAGQVYDSVDREAARIDWASMLHKGQVRMVRRREGGGYYTILTPPAGTTPTKRVAFRSSYVHVAVGYPGVKFLDDLQDYRERHRDFSRVVNAYEPHDHVYDELRARPGTVVVRGSGIVGSRILQRLIDDRDQHGAETTIWHLFRNYVDGPQGDSIFARRPGKDGFAYQAFNFPKAAWGGQLRTDLLKLPPEERPGFIRTTGGTNTAPRRSWREQLDRGRSEGFYRTHVGSVESVEPGPDGTTITRIRSKDGGILELQANFIIDATGLEAGVREHRLLADLLDHSGARMNPANRLDASPEFVLTGTESPPGKMYASGSITLGSYYSPVDSFLGLQYAALQIADDLARVGFARRIGPLRSVRHWWKWMRNKRI